MLIFSLFKAFFIIDAGNVKCGVPSLLFPFTVIVYLYPFVMFVLVTFVTVNISVLDDNISLVFKLLTVISDSSSMQSKLICAVWLFLTVVGLNPFESNVQIGAVLSTVVTSISLFLVLSCVSLKYTVYIPFSLTDLFKLYIFVSVISIQSPSVNVSVFLIKA